MADFYCPTAKLVIEIDGQIHNVARRADHDAWRDELITGFGVRVERIAAADVMRNAAAVASAMVETCLPAPLHHPALPDGPPPRGELGED